MNVLLIATLDTKGEEAAFARDRLREAGLGVTLLDAGCGAAPRVPPDIPANETFRAAGSSAGLAARLGRGEAVALAARGAAAVARRLFDRGEVAGVMGLGGSAGTTIASAAMRGLPLGVPKVMVSTLAGGQVRPFVGESDIVMVPAVVDVCGLNRVSKRVLASAAAALAGMVRAAPEAASRADADAKPIVAATMFGVTTPAVEAARGVLEPAGFETLVFHATGTGGRTMEALVSGGLVRGVLDLTTTELADELVGGVMSAGRDRLTAAGLRGVPQVVSVGALDMVNFGPRESVPARFEGRRFHVHNDSVTLMRTTPEEMDALGKVIAERASAASGPVTIVLPLHGVSALDAEGGPFGWPAADAALFQSLRNWLSPDVRLVEVEAHINDPAFGRAAAAELLRLLGPAGGG